MWRFIILGAFACMAHLAQAAEAGKVIFVAGKASVADQPAVDGGSVGEGQMLSTGADGFLYVKTIDSGLFILRPNTKARIVTYHVDDKNPANTQVKLELLSGVARSKSGNAVKQARQNFRFNTPVAAIGVRGTDFTVFTDNDTSRVAVISGAIVMSGFAGSCRPDGAGPCEGSTSRELSAAQRGQLLQLQRGQATPQLLQSSPLSPDQVSPPRPDEPLAHAGSTGGGANSVTGQTNLDVQKTVSLNEAWEMVFHRKEATGKTSRYAQVLPRGSVAILSGASRSEWTHEIPKRKKEAGVLRVRRVSVTFRKVNAEAPVP